MLYSKIIEEKVEHVSDKALMVVMIALAVVILLLALTPENRGLKIFALAWILLP